MFAAEGTTRRPHKARGCQEREPRTGNDPHGSFLVQERKKQGGWQGISGCSAVSPGVATEVLHEVNVGGESPAVMSLLCRGSWLLSLTLTESLGLPHCAGGNTMDLHHWGGGSGSRSHEGG